MVGDSQLASDARASAFEQNLQLTQHKLSLALRHDKENERLERENGTLTERVQALEESVRRLQEVLTSLNYSSLKF